MIADSPPGGNGPPDGFSQVDRAGLSPVGPVANSGPSGRARPFAGVSPLDAALAYRELGLSTIPVKTDGSKAPAISGWREYAERQPTVEELYVWHADPTRYGIGVTGGA